MLTHPLETVYEYEGGDEPVVIPCDTSATHHQVRIVALTATEGVFGFEVRPFDGSELQDVLDEYGAAISFDLEGASEQRQRTIKDEVLHSIVLTPAVYIDGSYRVYYRCW